jgi:hypothetical protein
MALTLSRKLKSKFISFNDTSKSLNQDKSYADKRRRPIEFEVGDYVYLKVSPMKGVQ